MPDSRFTYAIGKLVAVEQCPRRRRRRGDASTRASSQSSRSPIPTRRPYGAAAIETMKALGVFDPLQPKTRPGRRASRRPSSSSTPGTPNSDLSPCRNRMASRLGSRWLVPEISIPPIRQDAVLLKKGEQRRASKAFLAFLKGPEARAIIEKFGYSGSSRSLRGAFPHIWQPSADPRTGERSPRCRCSSSATPLAWWLARSKRRWKEVVATVVVPAAGAAADCSRLLPPDRARAGRAGRGDRQPLGRAHARLHLLGLVIGSHRLGDAVRRAADPQRFRRDRRSADGSGATLRASPSRAFWTVALPLASPGLLTGAVLGFAHTVGEFGVVLMIGGNIPGKTRSSRPPSSTYVETMQWREANILAGGMVVFAFFVILSMTHREALRADARHDSVRNPRRVPRQARQVRRCIRSYAPANGRHRAVWSVGLRQDHGAPLHRRTCSFKDGALRYRRRIWQDRNGASCRPIAGIGIRLSGGESVSASLGRARTFCSARPRRSRRRTGDRLRRGHRPPGNPSAARPFAAQSVRRRAPARRHRPGAAVPAKAPADGRAALGP